MSFGQKLLDALKRLLTSAKFITAITGLVVAFAAKRGIVLSPDDVQAVLLFFSVLISAQGITDWGKSAAQVKAVAPPAPETVVTQTNIQEGPTKPPA